MRQSTGTETQRTSLEAASAGGWYNMVGALVVTGAPNLLNKRSIQWQQQWHPEKKEKKNLSQWTRKKARDKREAEMKRSAYLREQMETQDSTDYLDSE